jgi:adenylate kinase
MAKTIIIFFGSPGSGKGTQADLLSKKTGWKKISAGDLLRAEVAAGTKIGKMAGKFLIAGKLVPNRLLIGLMDSGLRKKALGYIFDGYPRNSDQQKDFLLMLKKRTKKSDQIYALEVGVGDKEVKERLGLRRMCPCGAVYHLTYNPPINAGICDICGGKLIIRNDDKPKVIAHRLKVYHRASKALLDYWQKQGRLIKINGEQPIKRIHEEIINKLKELNVV